MGTVEALPSVSVRPVIDRPAARGPLSAHLLDQLLRAPGELEPGPEPKAGDPLADDDEAFALYLCYELCYRGLPGADERWEWEPSLIAWRGTLESRLLGRLADSLGPGTGGEVGASLEQVLATDAAPSLSSYLRDHGTVRQVREFLIHRSAYQLKEADPHTWVIPRLSGKVKAALVEIQHDEYGSGEPSAMHSVLFERTLEGFGLDPRYGAYLDAIPGITLSCVNLISFFALHRRWRGALVGHLAGFEMSSVIPNRRYGAALRRLGFGGEEVRFFDAHVEADRHHQVLALEHLARGLAEEDPGLAADIVFGARSLCMVEGLWSRHCVEAWATDASSLRYRCC
jgi:hypothetical protein